MKQNLKNFNFYNFNLKQESPCVNKNEFSALEHYNLKLNSQVIKPVLNFKDFLKSHFSANIIETIFENYPEYKNKFTSVYLYEYFDDYTNMDKTLIFALDDDCELYEISLDNNQIFSLNIEFESEPVVFQNNEKIYFYSKNDKFIYFYKSDSYISVSNFIDLQDYVNYQNKLFFATRDNPFTLFYTEKIDIEDIDESLSLYENVSLSNSDGKILKIIYFKGSIFVIQQYAISKLSGTEGNYYFSSNCTINSRIFEGTIGKVNDYIIFYTTSGLYLFDGNEIKQIFNSVIDGFKVDANLAKALVFNNKYYFLTSVFANGSERKIVAEFDVYTNTCNNYYLAGLENISLIATLDCYELVLLTKVEDKYYTYIFDENNLSKNGYYLKTNNICFDEAKLKSISAVKIICDGEFNLKISSEKSNKILSVSGNTEIDNLGLSGCLFNIEIYGNEDFELDSMIFSVESIQN
jgi:hypothetical protein